VGWLSGLTASGVFLFSIILGLFFVYKSRKTKLSLLLYLGLIYVFAGLVYLGDFLDFATVLTTGYNIKEYSWIGIVNWMWFPGAIICAIYLGAQLILTKKKWLIVSIYIGLGIIFELFLFFDPAGTITYSIPLNPGEDLINDNIILESVDFVIALIYLLSILIFLGVGFLSKAIQSTGAIRKKFLFLSAGAFVYTIGGILDGLFSPGIALIFIRSAMIISAWLFYVGLGEKAI